MTETTEPESTSPMSSTPKRLRSAALLLLLLSTGAILGFSPTADALGPCTEQGRYSDACIALYGDDRTSTTADDTTSTPTPTPTPTPEPTPAPDYQQMHDDALAAALSLIDAELQEPPGWRTWPTRDLLVVNLETFFFINENWETEKVSATATDAYDPTASVTVTVKAKPERSHWTLTELVSNRSHTFTCDGPGSEWTPGSTHADCGWTADHSESVTGLLGSEVQIEYELFWESTYLGTSSVFDTRFGCPNNNGLLRVQEVQTFGISEAGSGTQNVSAGPRAQGSVQAPSCGSGPDGGDADDEGNGFSTEHPRGDEVLGHHIVCPASAGASVAGFDFGGGQETDIEQYIFDDGSGRYQLGSTVISIAAEGTVGRSVETTNKWFPESAIGTYFGASASAALTLSYSNQWVVDPDQDAEEALQTIHRDTTLGFIDEAANGLGLANIDQAPEMHSWSVGAEVSVAAGVKAGAGVDVDALNLGVALGADIEANVGTAYRSYADGRHGVIVTAGGSLGGSARAKAQLQLLEAAGIDPAQFDSLGAGVGGLVTSATGTELAGIDLASIEILANYQIEYIWEDGELVQAIVNTTYGWDADFLGDDDGLVVTKQTTTLDLTDPVVLADFEDSLYTGIDGDGHIDGAGNGPLKYTVENEVGGVDWGGSLLGLKTEWGCYIEMIGFAEHNPEFWNA